MKKINCLLAALVLAAVLMACGAKAPSLPDLSGLGTVTVVSREDGSGTREEFETLIGTAETGTTALAMSTEEAAALVAGDESAIGYAAYSALTGTEGVKALSIDGVALTADTVQSGDYPLRRNYCLAYIGELTPAEADFLAYIQSAGQAVVAETAIPVSKAATFLSDKSAGEIAVCGSSSVAPLMEALAADYAEHNPNAVITIQVTDSTAGLNAALRGECDLAMSSRSLKDYEAELLTTQVIAADGLAVLVNAENPLEGLTTEQVRTLYDGDCPDWGGLR